MVLENRHFCLVSGKDNFDCIEVSTHTLCIGGKPVEMNQYLGAFHMCGICFSFLIFLSSEIDQPIYLHVNTRNDVQKCIQMQLLMKSGILSDQFQSKF